MFACQLILPLTPRSPWATALPLVIDGELPVPADECVIDFVAIRELRDDSSHTMTGLLVAAC